MHTVIKKGWGWPIFALEILSTLKGYVVIFKNYKIWHFPTYSS